MSEAPIKFDDGAAYEAYMGRWSQLAGDRFLDWLAPAPGLHWVDVGCGNGAFTEMLVDRCAAAGVAGIDPSVEQLAFARTTAAAAKARFQIGDAMNLPFADQSFDAAVMALVLFFVPEPARGVAEMRRVVRPGGSVSAYLWDFPGGGFPYAAFGQELRALGVAPSLPPSVEASRIEVLLALWRGAGLVEVETCEISVQRSFADFESFWAIAILGPSIAPKLAQLSAADAALLKARLRARFPADADGRITYGARANAVKGQVPDLAQPPTSRTA